MSPKDLIAAERALLLKAVEFGYVAHREGLPLEVAIKQIVAAHASIFGTAEGEKLASELQTLRELDRENWEAGE